MCGRTTLPYTWAELNALMRLATDLGVPNHERWLSLAEKDSTFLQSLLVPYPAAEREAYQVSTLVNRAAVDQPGCVEPRTE
jgi:putative SOS response-associated peptidase YedK